MAICALVAQVDECNDHAACWTGDTSLVDCGHMAAHTQEEPIRTCCGLDTHRVQDRWVEKHESRGPRLFHFSSVHHVCKLAFVACVLAEA